MELSRIAVRLDLAGPEALDPEELVPVFHEWIRRAALPGVLIDVARYAHVPGGPGVMLIGHDADYGLELAGGQGLVVTRKRDLAGGAAERIGDAVRRALVAAELLEAEPALGGRAALCTDALTVRVLDRLHAPNTPQTLAALTPALEDVAAALWPDQEASLVATEEDAREAFGVRLAVPEGPGLARLVARVAEVAVPVA